MLINFISNFPFLKGFLSFYIITIVCKSSGYFTCLQYFLLSVSVIRAFLVFVKWYLSVVLICSSLQTNNVKKIKYFSFASFCLFFCEVAVGIFSQSGGSCLWFLSFNLKNSKER